jgi:hypothetical protein
MCGIAGVVRCEGAIADRTVAALGVLGQFLDRMSSPC